jgi:hypothetical protein
MAASIHLDVLDSIRPASPCTARWEDMTGDERVRHCASCDLDVFNVEDMTRDEALTLIRRKIDEPEARICARLRVRSDGKVITRDCPVGLARLRRRISTTCSRLGAAAMFLVTFGAIASRAGEDFHPRVRHVGPIASARAWLIDHAPSIIRPKQACFMMGDIAMPPMPPNVPQGANDLYFRAAFEN